MEALHIRSRLSLRVFCMSVASFYRAPIESGRMSKEEIEAEAVKVFLGVGLSEVSARYVIHTRCNRWMDR